MKKFTCALLAFVLIFGCTSAAFAAYEETDFEDAEDVIIDIPLELISVTEEHEPLCVKGDFRITPERQVTKTYHYLLKDGAGINLTGVEVTVTGTYSQADGYAQIDNLDVRVKIPSSEVEAATPHYYGNTAMVSVHYGKLTLKTFKYEITSTGIIYDRTSQ